LVPEAPGARAIDRFNAQMQSVVDRVFGEMRGRPVAAVTEVLGRRWLDAAGTPCPPPILAGIAAHISEGRPVSLRPR
jgi:hypothetical protein